MSQDSLPTSEAAPSAPSQSRSMTSWCLIGAAYALLLGFIVLGGRLVWNEWTALQLELTQVRSTDVIGFPGISPVISHAAKPVEWFRVEGDHALLWSGWRDGEGHQWFRLEPGDLDRNRISNPLGRDAVRAIDQPIAETVGGELWNRIPDQAGVFGEHVGESDVAYPVLVLQKVFVINDRVGERSLLVTYNPFELGERKVTVYEPMVDGQRIVMGTAGYVHDEAPMLYDRATESLWVTRNSELRAISGAHKGHVLPAVSRPTLATWSDWRSGHPRGRVVVGAVRGRTSGAL